MLSIQNYRTAEATTGGNRVAAPCGWGDSCFPSATCRQEVIMVE